MLEGDHYKGHKGSRTSCSFPVVSLYFNFAGAHAGKYMYLIISLPISWANCFRWLEVSNLFSCLAIVPNLTGCAMEGGRRRSVLQQKTSYIPELYRVVRTTYNIYNRYEENPLRDTEAADGALQQQHATMLPETSQPGQRQPIQLVLLKRVNQSTTYHHQSTITNYHKVSFFDSCAKTGLWKPSFGQIAGRFCETKVKLCSKVRFLQRKATATDLDIMESCR